MALARYVDDSGFSIHSAGRGILSELKDSAATRGTESDCEASLRTVAESVPGVTKVHACLGEGSYSCVWECTVEETDAHVAVKVWKRGQLVEETRECTLLQELRHPNLVRLYRLVSVEGQPSAMIMDLCSGGDLRELLHGESSVATRAALGLLPRLRMARDVARCIAFLHENSVMHRDIKPSNCFLSHPIFLPQVPQVKLGDLGFARRVEGAQMSYGVGTLRYMAPEAADPAADDSDEEDTPSGYSFPADIFSAGMLLYELFTGRVPFSEEQQLNNEIQLILAVNEGRRPPLESLREDLGIVIDGCWDHTPAERINAQELLDFLDNMVEEEETAG